MEKDRSDEAKLNVSRSSTAIMNKDSRKGLNLHSNKDSDEEDEQVMQDLCPSWMGQNFQV